MVESKPRGLARHRQARNDTGADGIELNFGCPHGMSERGMGAAVGQVPDYVQMITEWVKERRDHPGDGQADAQRHRHPLRRRARRRPPAPTASR